MIRFSLTCPNDHHFDSWFQSAAAFDALHKAGHLSCAVCGDKTVQKALMAPAVAKNPSTQAQATAPQGKLQTAEQQAQAIAELRRQIETNSDYVGMNFVSEARAMHEGILPERAIYGEARPDEAIKLLQDGIPVAPLPFIPRRKTN